jgi:hypothetical protein
MDKANRIIKLIEEKSSTLMAVYSDLVELKADLADLAEVIGAVGALDELHAEVKLIIEQDD